MRTVLGFTVCLGACAFELPRGNAPPVEDAASEADAPAPVTCPSDYNLISGPHKLRFTDAPYGWAQAQAFCMAHGGHLVKIEDDTLDNFIRDKIVEGMIPFVWIGLYDPLSNDSYKWYDDTPLGSYQNFSVTPSNGDCVDKDTTDLTGTWHPWNCSFLQPGVCECNG